jgi:hypothetical protein
MKEHPILMNSAMVRATLAGSKTQTRRVVKPQPSEHWTPYSYGEVHKMREDGEFVMRKGAPVVLGFGPSNWDGDEAYACPYGQPGDRLWVREAFDPIEGQSPTHPVIGVDYRASHPTRYPTEEDRHKAGSDAINIYQWRIKDSHGMRKWKPSIHMPRWASRIDLEITSVRVERLQDISETDAAAEGIEGATICGVRYWRDYSLSDDEAQCSPMLTSQIASFRSLWESINGPGSWDSNPWVWVIEFRRVQP